MFFLPVVPFAQIPIPPPKPTLPVSARSSASIAAPRWIDRPDPSTSANIPIPSPNSGNLGLGFRREDWPVGRIPQSLDRGGKDSNLSKLARSNLLGNLQLSFPLGIPAPITSRFGWRTHPVLGEQRFHAGVDFGAAAGTPVVAAAGGYVHAAEEMGGYGLAIVMEHLDGSFQTLYGHLSEILVSPGMAIQAGQIIGKVGSTGLSTGPHLHFEVRQRQGDDWVAIDPLPKLPSSGEMQSTTQALFKQRQFMEERAWVQRMTVER
ncbi:MAG: hypothetical protein B0A82_22790 [Alkalinema sp. CACIAM 70d]|nr:MAG: hypothetical protein B0A82_22790 [Alkalinema sp. CACIAM 70d]